jgi:4-hydroxy-3-polyprenylbenzoate decarboxylase
MAMTYPSVAELLESLRQTGQLALVEAEVNPVLEVAEITNRLAQAGGTAILFGNVQGHEIPLVTHLLGTESRICHALGVESLTALSDQIAELVAPSEPESWLEKLRAVPARTALGKFAPKRAKTGACQQVVKLASDVDLGELPAIQSLPDEPGRRITSAQVFTADAESGRAVVGHYDLAVLDRRRLAACWLPHDSPARLLEGYRQRGQRMPVAVVLGGNPAGLLAAMAPLPPQAEVTAVAGFLRGSPQELVKCRSIALDVPADAEIILEGTIDPAEPPVETGLIAASGGYYQLSRPAAVIQVSAVTHRANPVFPALVRGPVPDEACAIHRFLERAFLPLVRQAIPDLVDLELPLFGTARHWALASIRKEYAGQARRVAAALWGMRSLMFAKLLVLVDAEVDLQDTPAVLEAIARQVDPGRDVFFHQGPPDALDPTSSADALGHRMALDATTKLPEERRVARPAAGMTDAVRRLVSERWQEYGFQVD